MRRNMVFEVRQVPVRRFNDFKDQKTGIRVVSIYRSNRKPKPEQLKDIEYMVFDMRDVSVRFYTYLSTMHYVMGACAEQGILVLVLDRPNPNGFYVDGPLLDTAYRSFVGMHAISIVHGMTLGELALMINGEKWLAKKIQCSLTVIPCANYTHNSRYQVPVKPSPNLPNMQPIYWYPSLCLFEGTPLSVGRGTDYQFQVFGHSSFKGKKGYEFTFTPTAKDEKLKPLLEGQLCYGKDFRKQSTDQLQNEGLELGLLIRAYQDFGKKEAFFNKMFTLLTGSKKLQQQIVSGKSVEEIKVSWQADLNKFKLMRGKYLLYPDFD